MGFFDKLFGKNDPQTPPPPAGSPPAENPPPVIGPKPVEPPIFFGHYVDANKTAQQLAKWEEANTLFTQKNYRDSFLAFLEYICDPVVKNVTWEYKGNTLHFSLEQGSKIIRGLHDGDTVSAYALLAEFGQPPIEVMLRLLASN